MTIFLMYGCVLICLMAFILITLISVNFSVRKRQKEWDELKAMLVAFAPSITQDDLREAYINYIDSIECYYPRF